MFEQTFVPEKADRRPWAPLASLGIEAAFVAALLIVPLLHIPALVVTPRLPEVHMVHIASPAPVPQLAVHEAFAVGGPSIPSPVRIYDPQRIVRTTQYRPVAWAEPSEGFVVGATEIGVPSSLVSALPSLAMPVPENHAAPVPAVPHEPQRVSAGVEAAMLTFGPKPEYPNLARITHTQGVVRIEAVIGTDGSVREARILSGPSLLSEAAINAVRRWKYRPTLLSGVPVEVITEIEVNFLLGN